MEWNHGNIMDLALDWIGVVLIEHEENESNKDETGQTRAEGFVTEETESGERMQNREENGVPARLNHLAAATFVWALLLLVILQIKDVVVRNETERKKEQKKVNNEVRTMS